VLAYVTPDKRQLFADLLTGLPGVWLSNEAPGVVPGVRTPGVPGPADGTAPFLLIRDGRSTVALTDPHGTWVRWLG
jgi:hypothetical protein